MSPFQFAGRVSNDAREWGRGREEGKGGNCFLSPKILSCQKIVTKFFVGKVLSKNTKFGLKPPILGKFKGKIESLSTHVGTVCRKIATSCPAYFFNPRRR